MEKNKDIKKLSDRLNLIASLLLDIKQELGEKTSVKEKVKYVLERGISDDGDISAIVGITKSHASKEKAIIRKKGEKQNG